MILEGRARIVGDDVNTDYIISSRRKRETIDESELAQWLLEGVDPRFAATVKAGDILVAGRNFGCGSAMEVAATVIRGAGIRGVVAKSFARSFYRNAINNGLPVAQLDTSGIVEGQHISVPLAASMSGIMVDILAEGGLVEYLRTHGGLPRQSPR